MTRRGLTQVRLGEMACYDARTIRNVLNGLPVRDTTLFDLCATLKLELPQLAKAKVPGLDGAGPSVAVLPFLNLSGDTEHDYLVDGAVEDIIIELARFSELAVIARNSSFQFKGRTLDARRVGRELGVRYVVEGSIRLAGRKVRINVQLIDASIGAILWAEHYDQKIDGLFLIQDGIARAVASVLAARMNKAEASRVMNKPPETWGAYDFYLRAADLFATFPINSNAKLIYEVRRLLENALAIDPTYARAYTLLSATYMATWLAPLDSDTLQEAVLHRGLECAERAVQLDPNLSQAHGQLGHVLVNLKQHDRGLLAFERARALNPSYSDWRYPSSLTFAGRFEAAVDIVNAQTAFDPFYPAPALAHLGLAWFGARRYKEAMAPLAEAITLAPLHRPIHLFSAANYSRLGMRPEAQLHARKVMELDPTWRLSRTPKILAPYKNAADFLHFVESLRLAGLLE